MPELQMALVDTALPAPTHQLVDVTDIADSELLGRQPDKELVDSIRRWGVMQPIWLSLDPAGHLHLIAGRSRVAAAKYGLTVAQTEAEYTHCLKVPALVWPDDVPVSDMALLENAMRSDNPVLDYVMLSRLREQGRDYRSVLATTGMGKSTQEKRLKLAKLSQPLYEALLTGTAGAFSTYEQAATLPAELQARLADILQVKGKLTADDVKAVKMVVKEETAEGIADQLELGLVLPDWRSQVIQHLEAIAPLVPPDQQVVRLLLENLRVALVTQP